MQNDSSSLRSQCNAEPVDPRQETARSVAQRGWGAQIATSDWAPSPGFFITKLQCMRHAKGRILVDFYMKVLVHDASYLQRATSKIRKLRVKDRRHKSEGEHHR